MDSIFSGISKTLQIVFFLGIVVVGFIIGVWADKLVDNDYKTKYETLQQECK